MVEQQVTILALMRDQMSGPLNRVRQQLVGLRNEVKQAVTPALHGARGAIRQVEDRTDSFRVKASSLVSSLTGIRTQMARLLALGGVGAVLSRIGADVRNTDAPFKGMIENVRNLEAGLRALYSPLLTVAQSFEAGFAAKLEKARAAAVPLVHE